MPVFLMELAFRGTNYHGFQVQQNALSVCETLQNAMEKVLGSRVDVKGCSRTDSGVHARHYCVSFAADTALSCEKLPLAFNAHLPEDIRILSARRVPESFHARYSAVSKQYIYRIFQSAVDDPFEKGLYWRIAQPLDVPAMAAAALCAVGRHDFKSFMSAGGSPDDTVRTVFDFAVEQQGDYVQCRIRADGYLYNMVRILVGTLAEVGLHRSPADAIKTALNAGDRAFAGPTAPSQGLFLDRVFYPPQALDIGDSDERTTV